MSKRSSGAGRGFERDADAIRWTGRADGDASPEVTVVVSRSAEGAAALERALDGGDPRDGDEAVRAVAMPHGMLDALARRCAAADASGASRAASGVGAPDPRWSAALARALGGRRARGAGRAAEPTVAYTPPDGHGARQIRALPDGRVVVLSAGAGRAGEPVHAAVALEPRRGRWAARAFVGGAGTRFALPDSNVERVWLVEQRADDGATIVRGLDARGEPTSAEEAVARSPARRVTVVSSRRWLHCDRHHVSLDRDVTLEHGDPGGAPLLVGDHLLTFSPREFDRAAGGWVSRSFRWVDLATATPGDDAPWGELVHGALVVGDAAFVATGRGVFALAPGRAPELLFEGTAHGLCARGERLLWFTGPAAHVYDARARAEERAIALRGSCYGGGLTEGCVVASDLARALVYDRRGALVYDSGERREPAAVTLADGTTVVSAGEEVTSFDRDGRLVAQGRADYDGQLVGATDRCAIFGPVSGGHARTEPTGLIAFDAQARPVARLPHSAALPARRPARTLYAGGTRSDEGLVQRDRVLLVDAAGALRAWAPGAVAAPTPPAPRRRAVDERARVVRPHATNPRDDWPEAALDVSGQSALALDSHYRGTTGVSPERAVVARDGAVVTLVRCDLAGDGGGATVRQRSTLVLVDCKFDRSQITVEPGSHLLVLATA